MNRKSLTRSSKYCSSLNCNNARGRPPGLSFFSFPKDVKRCEKWAVNCGRQDLLKQNTSQLHKTRLLCADHFEDKQFMCQVNRNSLVQNATPIIFNLTNRPKPSVSIYLKNSSTQTNSPRESKSTQFNYLKDLLVIDDHFHPKLIKPKGQKLKDGGGQNEDSMVCHFVVPTFREELLEGYTRFASLTS